MKRALRLLSAFALTACATYSLDLGCFDKAGRKKRSFGRSPSPKWVGVRGDDLYWFDYGASLELRHAKL